MLRNHSLQGMSLVLLAVAITCSAGQVSDSRAVEAQASWWMSPRRMVQTNLREIDARMDLDAYV